MAEHVDRQEIRPARKPAEPPKRVTDTLPDKLRAIAHRGHMVRAADVATLVTAAQAIEAYIDRHKHDIRVYGGLLGDLVETRTQLLSLREMVQAGLEYQDDR
jgi:hypothetical protein